MDLSIVKRKLESKTKAGECYSNPEGLVADVRLIFFNCAKYYKVNVCSVSNTLHANQANNHFLFVVIYHLMIMVPKMRYL